MSPVCGTYVFRHYFMGQNSSRLLQLLAEDYPSLFSLALMHIYGGPHVQFVDFACCY